VDVPDPAALAVTAERRTARPVPWEGGTGRAAA
jgi:hypothetical protein